MNELANSFLALLLCATTHYPVLPIDFAKPRKYLSSDEVFDNQDCAILTIVGDTFARMASPHGSSEVLSPSGSPKPGNVVSFSHDDPGDPRNWPQGRKWLLIGPIVLIDLSVSFAASGFSPAAMSFEKDMGVSSEVGTLGLSMYVLGLALGPMTLAPLSEVCSARPHSQDRAKIVDCSTSGEVRYTSAPTLCSFAFCWAQRLCRTLGAS